MTKQITITDLIAEKAIIMHGGQPVVDRRRYRAGRYLVVARFPGLPTGVESVHDSEEAAEQSRTKLTRKGLGVRGWHLSVERLGEC